MIYVIWQARVGITRRKTGKHQEVMRLDVCIRQNGLTHTVTLSLIPLRNIAICCETALRALWIAMLSTAMINQIEKFTSNVHCNI